MTSLPFRIGAAALACAAAAAAPAQVADSSDRLQQVSTRGALLFAYDSAAWLGTDDMLKRVPDAKTRIAGWIVDGPADRARIIFYDREPTPRAVYVAQMSGGKLVDPMLPTGDAALLSTDQLAMIAARTAARAALASARITSCTTRFNTVVLPPDEPGGPTRVYFLSARTAADKVVIGGHYRVDVDTAGRASVPFAFSKGCLTQDRPPKDAKSPVLFATTLTDTIPNETHVFTATSYGLPLIVGVPGPDTAMTMYAALPGRPVRRIEIPAAKGTAR
ncbi:hypothetical protein ASE86_01970 [Sphingomonas sp. Leaf33]|uniref:hypothetical protein n=1 Tax=Sphingomonas sp. Leaf33 TaxID=1736215 RepID=UPI000701D58F|nr:hypothetical protein [Sphingomonas sp. Leaf33]KQN25058.1 hypothetical protein ASE86_01970 [Sphingomonas sp. Leaf33]